MSPEVSDLDYTNSVSFNGFTIPGLTKRNLSTTVELKEGQTFAVAGLLNTRLNATKAVTPLLGRHPGGRGAVPVGALPAERDGAGRAGDAATGRGDEPRPGARPPRASTGRSRPRTTCS